MFFNFRREKNQKIGPAPIGPFEKNIKNGPKTTKTAKAAELDHWCQGARFTGKTGRSSRKRCLGRP